MKMHDPTNLCVCDDKPPWRENERYQGCGEEHFKKRNVSLVRFVAFRKGFGGVYLVASGCACN